MHLKASNTEGVRRSAGMGGEVFDARNRFKHSYQVFGVVNFWSIFLGMADACMLE